VGTLGQIRTLTVELLDIRGAVTLGSVRREVRELDPEKLLVAVREAAAEVLAEHAPK
jgi:hypothetical protein